MNNLKIFPAVPGYPRPTSAMQNRNFKGAFGILDSGRVDVDYEDWYGHKLDRKLLDLKGIQGYRF